MPANSSSSGCLAFVTQATNTLLKVKTYINAGMETTLDVAVDLFGENETVTLPPDETKASELKDVMLDYARMERELNDFLAAVEHTVKKARDFEGESGTINLESLLDQRLADLQEGYTDDTLYQHDKYVDLLGKISESQKNTDDSAVASGSNQGSNDGVEYTQEEVVTKCPYTGKEMTDPMENKHCHHNYEREGIMEYIKRRGRKAKCPVGGCSNTTQLTKGDLIENKTLRRHIEMKGRQSGKRQKRADTVFNV